ncbi:hypothetical protein VN97_g4391 [Penicillium thymicola]|uniref:Uncharacterized protein n=1 Tax=Penicillium thymicola TaxID=293382 RepID=A0AAI9TKM6_PENTH|nr:hypothetical protein VN97_g4391 [Penicillium thymicola]
MKVCEWRDSVWSAVPLGRKEKWRGMSDGSEENVVIYCTTVYPIKIHPPLNQRPTDLPIFFLIQLKFTSDSIQIQFTLEVRIPI